MDDGQFVSKLCFVLFLLRITSVFGFTFDIIPRGARLVDPPARSSLWREGHPGATVNHLDHRQNCGGKEVQWNQNHGRCGVCGDSWSATRDNELGGKYDSGKISRVYIQNSTIIVTSLVSENLSGWLEFRIFPSNVEKTMWSTDDNLLLSVASVGDRKYKVFTSGYHVLPIKLPEKLSCERCTFQWKFQTGISWNDDESLAEQNFNGMKEEQYYGCSDITIVKADLSENNTPLKYQTQNYQDWWCHSQCIGEQCAGCNYDGEHGRHKRATQTCHGIPPYNNDQMTEWCTVNCAHDFCPETHCTCLSETTVTTELPTTHISSLFPDSTSTNIPVTSFPTTSAATKGNEGGMGEDPTRSTTVGSTITTAKSNGPDLETTSSITSSFTTSTNVASSTTDKALADPPDIVQVLSTLGCSYCQKTNNDGCRKRLCHGYNKSKILLRGNLSERLQQLSDLFCSYCGAETACRILFCPKNYFLLSRAQETRCQLCQRMNDTACLQDKSCLGSSPLAEGNAAAPFTVAPTTYATGTKSVSSAATTTDSVPLSTSKSDAKAAKCVSAGVYAGSAGMDAWCDVNCKASPPNCPRSHCSCTSTNDHGLDVQLLSYPGEDCRAQPHLDPGVTEWCRQNCPIFCPSSHCYCSEDTATQEQTTFTSPQATMTTTEAMMTTMTPSSDIDINISGQLVCRATPNFAKYANMDEWCRVNCYYYCPSDYCMCELVSPTTESGSSSVASSLKPTTQPSTTTTSSTTSAILSSSSTSCQSKATVTVGSTSATSHSTVKTHSSSSSTQQTTTESISSSTVVQSDMTGYSKTSDPSITSSFPNVMTTTSTSGDSTTIVIDTQNVSSSALVLQNILCTFCAKSGSECSKQFCPNKDSRRRDGGPVNRKFATMMQCSFFESSPQAEIFCYGQVGGAERFGRTLDSSIDTSLCYSCMLVNGDNCSPTFC